MSPRILVLSPPRTGTQSIADALQVLGYDNVYHMREVPKNNHRPNWIELIDSRFGPEQKPVTRAQFETILGNYDALADFPATLFATDLIATYPDAKVIVNIRDEDAWCNSMMHTLVPGFKNRRPDPDDLQYVLMKKYHSAGWDCDFDKNGRQFFRSYYDNVRAAAPKDNTLEYSVKSGWDPLCEFLGVPVPEQTFPWSDEATYKKDKVAS